MAEQKPADEQRARFLITQPLGRFSFLWLITLGFYGFYWHYMSWRFFGYRKLNAVLCTIFSGLSIYVLAKRVFKLANGQGIATGVEPGIIMFFYLLGNYIVNKATGFWFLLGISLTLFPILYLQRCLNMYWLKLKPEYSQKSFFSGGFIVWSVAGVILCSLVVIGILDEISV